jgi:hypothetical protein
MTIRAIKLPTRALGAVLALGLAGVSLAGCVYYPSGYGGYGYAPGYYAAPAYVAPPVVIGGWWGGGWGGGWGGDHDGGGHWHH